MALSCEHDELSRRRQVKRPYLQPYSTYKVSGVPWLSSIPDQWNFGRTKFLFKEKDQRSGEHGGVLLSLTRHRGLIPQSEASNRIASVQDTSNYRVCRRGDLVMNRMQAWSGMFAVSSYEGVVSPDYSVFEAVVPMEVRFFESLFRTPIIVSQFALRSKGIGDGFNRLYANNFGDVPVPIPPLPEQTAIVRFLDHVGRRIQHYINSKQKLIALLEEKKQTIIHEAVTGQIDVRTGKPYPAYKSSEVEWLGDVPEHWEVRRLKTLCRMKSGDGITAVSIESEGKYPVYGGNGLRGYTAKYTHSGDFALIGRQGALCGNVHIARGQFYASEHAVVATLDPGYVLEWFVPVLGEMDLNRYSIAAAQPGLAVERILNLSLPVPPSGEQANIATFIERQSGDSDNSINKTRRQIDLIREYHTRLIADVVTGKVDVRDTMGELPGADSIADLELDGTVYDRQSIIGEHQRHVGTEDQVKELPT